MSWHIDLIGESKDVSAAIAQETNLPENLRKMVEEICSASPDSAVHVESNGHIGQVGSCINSFRAMPVMLAKPKPPPGDLAPKQSLESGSA